MNNSQEILKPIPKISKGIFLPHLKRTAETETVVMPAPKIVYLPLAQHIGAPATPIVKKGDKVFVGTLIAEASSFVSANVHSSVSGTVKDIAPVGSNGTCIAIESDGEMTPDPELKPFPVNNREDLVSAADKCGLVGLGGAGFPAKVKLAVKEDVPIDTLIINGAECEPYITSDYREALEEHDDILDGVYLIQKILDIANVIICVESNKKKAIAKLLEIAEDKRDENNSVRLMMLPTQYPQGAEKVLIYSATGRKVPLGKLPSDVGCIVLNITSVATLARFIKTGMPLVSKRVTVDGNAIDEPKNVKVPLGTPIKELLEFVGTAHEDADEIIMGGPMMGVDVADMDSVVEKRNNAITVMKSPTKKPKETACIRCGRCVRACPMGLYPAAIAGAVKKGDIEAIRLQNVNYCMECGSCSFICPAKKELTQSLRLAKAILRKEKA